MPRVEMNCNNIRELDNVRGDSPTTENCIFYARARVCARRGPDQFQKFAVNQWPKLIFQLISEIGIANEKSASAERPGTITFVTRRCEEVQIKSLFYIHVTRARARAYYFPIHFQYNDINYIEK